MREPDDESASARAQRVRETHSDEEADRHERQRVHPAQYHDDPHLVAGRRAQIRHGRARESNWRDRRERAEPGSDERDSAPNRRPTCGRADEYWAYYAEDWTAGQPHIRAAHHRRSRSAKCEAQCKTRPRKARASCARSARRLTDALRHYSMDPVGWVTRLSTSVIIAPPTSAARSPDARFLTPPSTPIACARPTLAIGACARVD